MTKTLMEFAKSKSTFVSIKDKESYSAVYRGFKFIEKDSFGETKEYARFLLEDLEDGVVRSLDSQSASFAEQMDGIKDGETITISRQGSGMETKYQVSLIDDGKPAKKNENS